MKASMAGLTLGRLAEKTAGRQRRDGRGRATVAAPGATQAYCGTCLEQALFAVTLGTLGYIWLGALLAEAAQGF